jgi:hypothetical protein
MVADSATRDLQAVALIERLVLARILAHIYGGRPHHPPSINTISRNDTISTTPALVSGVAASSLDNGRSPIVPLDTRPVYPMVPEDSTVAAVRRAVAIERRRSRLSTEIAVLRERCANLESSVFFWKEVALERGATFARTGTTEGHGSSSPSVSGVRRPKRRPYHKRR